MGAVAFNEPEVVPACAVELVILVTDLVEVVVFKATVVELP